MRPLLLLLSLAVVELVCAAEYDTANPTLVDYEGWYEPEYEYEALFAPTPPTLIPSNAPTTRRPTRSPTPYPTTRSPTPYPTRAPTPYPAVTSYPTFAPNRDCPSRRRAMRCIGFAVRSRCARTKGCAWCEGRCYVREYECRDDCL